MPMTYARPDALVSTEWLADHLDAPDVRIVDGSFYLPAQKRNPRSEYESQHIPGAVFFDIDEIADTTSSLPHMLPSPEKFSSRVRKLGLGDGNKIVIYDTTPMTGAARVWWMFRAMGHKDVSILDGGLPKWMAEGRPITDDPPLPRDRHFTARLDNTLVRSIDDVRELIGSKREQIIDARAAARFRGEAPEPRAGLRSGHMPSAFNLPYNDLIDPKTGTMLSGGEIAARIAASGIDPAKKVTASCGSGVTACVVALGLYLIGAPHAAVYDGSWTEWGGREDTPIVTGA
jgi:thiosulfate/3-mercaptopyruvate sulfurtransferase